MPATKKPAADARATNTTPKKPPARKPLKKSLPVIYGTITADVCQGQHALTVEQAKALLGWQEESESVKFGNDYLLVDASGNKVRCLSNLRNRPLNDSWCKTLVQSHLNKQWRLNGETVVIGRHGNVISGQHRLISLILSEQVRKGAKMFGGDQSAHWQKMWPAEMTMECIVVKGVDEGSETTRTIDNVRPRTLADVLFADNLFADKTPAERKALCRMLDYAVRCLWARTGADKNAYAPRRTHSEALDFISRHPSIVPAVAHIFTEDSKGLLSQSESAIGIGAGRAAGLLYLMAACMSDIDEYAPGGRPMSDRTEKKMDMGMWDKAKEFWTSLVAEMDPATVKTRSKFYGVRTALAEVKNKDRREEKEAVISKAWDLFSHDMRLDAAKMQLEYSEPDPEFGMQDCLGRIGLGGIDLGEAMSEPPAPESGDEDDAPALDGQQDEGDAGADADGDDAQDSEAEACEGEEVPTGSDEQPDADEPAEEMSEAQMEEAKAAALAESEAIERKRRLREKMEASRKDSKPAAKKPASKAPPALDPLAPADPVDFSRLDTEETYYATDGRKYYAGSTKNGQPVCDASMGRAVNMHPDDLKTEFPGGLPAGWLLEKNPG